MNEQMLAINPGKSLKQFIFCFWEDESGQDIIEYSLVAVAMGLFTVVGVHGLASSITNDLTTVLNAFNTATNLTP